MIIPDKIVAKQQNFSVICPGNDAKYHSNRYEYDYIKNTLDFATKILKNQIQKYPNPYFAIYKSNIQQYFTKASVDDFFIAKEPTFFSSLQKRIENTLFQENLLLPGLLEYISNLANDYDNEIEFD